MFVRVRLLRPECRIVLPAYLVVLQFLESNIDRHDAPYFVKAEAVVPGIPGYMFVKYGCPQRFKDDRIRFLDKVCTLCVLLSVGSVNG